MTTHLQNSTEGWPTSSHPSALSQYSRASIESISRGVARVHAAEEHMTTTNRAFILFGTFIFSSAYNLNTMLIWPYTYTAATTLGGQSNYIIVLIIRAVVASIIMPAVAKISDVFGRIETLLATVVLFVVGSLLNALAQNTLVFAVGCVIWQIGYNASMAIIEVIISDVTPLRSRLFFSYIASAPFLVTVWAGANVAKAMSTIDSWRFGYWIWAIIYPLCVAPLLCSLWWAERKAKKAGTTQRYVTPIQEHGIRGVTKALWWQLDVVGMFLGILALGCLLVPLSTNAVVREPVWGTAKFIVPMVTGVVLVPAWLKWESAAPYPMVPFHLIQKRTVWSPFGIAFFLMFCLSCVLNSLHLILRLVFDHSIEASQRTIALYPFVSTLVGMGVGVLAYHVRRLKRIIQFGTCVYLVGNGLLICYRHSNNGYIGALVVLGFGAGFFPYAAQASAQAVTSHQYVATVTCLYLTCYNAGWAVGNAATAVVHPLVVLPYLTRRMEHDRASAWYDKPTRELRKFPLGTYERDTAIEAYLHYELIIRIMSTCGCLALVGLSCCVANPRLPDTVSMADEEFGENVEQIQEREDVSGSFSLARLRRRLGF